MAGGGSYSLALTSHGTVLAWGANSVGQLGDGTTTDRRTPVPVELPAGTHVTAIAAGVVQSLALTSDGHIFAWGENVGRELGKNGPVFSSTPVPVKLPPGTRVTAIAANQSSSAALTSDGDIISWGAPGVSPLQIKPDLPAGTRVIAIAAGGFLLTSDGRVRDLSGQLAGPPACFRVIAVAGGLHHTLAVAVPRRHQG
jgi:alpha-tubulin suppressor-like RCC1 family protein